MNSVKGYTRKQAKDALFENRSPYETRTTAGAVLLRFLDEKRNVVVVRTADDAVVARSPELDS